MAHTVVFGGQRFFYNGRDYFRNASGQLLHRVIWAAAHGPIPRGHVVHHINEDKLDNQLENLRLMPKRDHHALHGPRGWAAWDTDQRARTTRALWRDRQPVERICLYCKQPYQTRSTTSRWCTSKCTVAARYHGLTGSPTRKSRPSL